MDKSSPIFRVLVGLALIVTLIIIVVLVGPGPKGQEVKVKEGDVGVVVTQTYLYQQGSPNSKAIEQLAPGTRLDLLSANGTMYKVKRENGDIAWVKASDVEVQSGANSQDE